MSAKKKVRKSVTALITSAAFMAGVAQLFKFLYAKDQEDEEVAETVVVDFVGNLFGGLPVIKDIYARLAEGCDLDMYAYSTINNMLDSAIDIFDAAGKLVSGNATSQDIASSLKKHTYSIYDRKEHCDFGINFESEEQMLKAFKEHFNISE